MKKSGAAGGISTRARATSGTTSSTRGRTDFTYKSPERKVISEFGEMEGCATPDNHSLMLHQMRTRRARGSAIRRQT